MATAEDAAAIRSIYAPFVRETVVSFETDIPSVEQISERIATTIRRFPWLIVDADGDVAGFAYAGAHRVRAAYRWSVDVAFYVDAPWRRRRLGTALYRALLAVLEIQGFANAFAGIALPNPASVALHESLGFEPLGVYRGVGFKFGEWRDVGWWQLRLRDDSLPDEPRPIGEVDIEPALAEATTDVREPRAAGGSLMTPESP